MIITSKKCFWMELPKLKRCALDECHIYQLILRNQYTKELFVFKVRDYLYDCNIRYSIKMELPDCMDYGEYEYFLIQNDEWYTEDINIDIIKNTVKYTDKEAISYNGMYIIIGDKMLVTSKYKARIFSNELPVTNSIQEKLVNFAKGKIEIQDITENLVTTMTSEDDRVEGEIVKMLNILNRGILRYKEDQTICCEPVKEYQSKNKSYIQYGG